MAKRILNKRETYLSGFGAFIASLCCFSPIVLVLLGLSTASFAGSLGYKLFLGYWWAFIGSGFLFMISAFYFYIRKKHNVCSLKDVNINRRAIIPSLILLVLIFFVIYLIWEIILEIVGI